MAKKKRGRGRGNPCDPEQDIPPGQTSRQVPPASSSPDYGEGAVAAPLTQFPRYFTTPPPPASEPSASAPPKQERKPRTVHPEELGIALTQARAIAPVLPERRGYCEEGRRIKLTSNCFNIEIPSGDVYHYDVEITKREGNLQSDRTDTKNKKFRLLNNKINQKIVSLMLSTNRNFIGVCAVYDGKKNLYTRKAMKTDFPLTCEVVLIDEHRANNDNTRRPQQDIYLIEIKPVNKKDGVTCAINLDSVHDYFARKTTSVPYEAIMALETIFRYGPSLRSTPLGRSFFCPPNPGSLNPLGGGLEIWFGYHQSVRLGQWKPVVNLDVAATAFLQEGPVLNYIAAFMNMNVDRLCRLPWNDSDIRRISRKLRQLQIRVTHLNYRRKHRIVKLIKESANKKYINFESNSKTIKKSIAQYFQEHHGMVLKYPNLPCLQVQPEKKNVFLPIEVCELIAGQPFKGELSSVQKSKMIEFTSASPNVRFAKIADIANKSNFKNDKYVQGFGLEVSNKPLNVDARVLEAQSLLYNDERNSPKHVLPKDGSWNVRFTHFFQGAKIPSWLLISFGRFPRQLLMNFADQLLSVGKKLGMEIDPNYDIVEIGDAGCDKQSLLKRVKNRASLAVIVIPTEHEYIYAGIKRAAETVIGLTTQCIKENTLRDTCGKRGPQIVSNLCLKINAKMGGENNSLVNYAIPNVLHKPVIVIGADVNHPPPTQLDKPSLAACVGSLDSYCKRTAVSIRAQMNSNEKKKKLEIICELEDMVVELLKAFYRHTRGKKPEKIIFYRDGVSEGEFAEVKKHEVVSIRKACRRLEPSYQPGITFIVVQKRHHVRFMPQNDRDGVGRMRNIPPGTVIDTTVTHPLNFDFFLCSHFGIQGTSRPSYYTVIEDDNEFSATELHKLTYQLCHMYVRCTKTISIPAPVAYADLVAYRARMHLEGGTKDDSISNNGFSRSGRLPQEDIEAIKVVDGLKSSMYFV